MDARKDRIGEHAAGHALAWAINGLGPVPGDPADRRDWQQRASSIGAYRELSGYDHPADPIGAEPVTAVPDIRAAWREALAGLRVTAEAALARQRGDHGTATSQHELAASYQALEEAYRQRETVFAATMADREDWEAATCAQRHLAVAADTELRRRHPAQPFPPLRSAEPEPEPEPATGTQRADLIHTPGEPPGGMGQLIADLAVAHRTFADRLANRQNLTVPSPDPGYGDLGQAFPPWPRARRDVILQPPKPEIQPSSHVLEHAADRDTDWEAGD